MNASIILLQLVVIALLVRKGTSTLKSKKDSAAPDDDWPTASKATKTSTLPMRPPQAMPAMTNQENTFGSWLRRLTRPKSGRVTPVDTETQRPQSASSSAEIEQEMA